MTKVSAKKNGKATGRKVKKVSKGKRQTVEAKANSKAKPEKKKKVRAKLPTGIDRAWKITVLAKENPRREGTAVYETFKLYKTGMTVEQFIEKGGRMGNVRTDLLRGNISLK